MRTKVFFLIRRFYTERRSEMIFESKISDSKASSEKYLTKLLSHAANKVPFYRERISTSRDLIGQFRQLEPLTKSCIRENSELLKSDDMALRHWYRNSSGGSTGQPVVFIQDRTFKDWILATENFFYRRMLNVDRANAKKVVLWGSERDIFKQSLAWKLRLINWFTMTTFLNTFRMSENDMRRYVEIINRNQPIFIKGYAGSLYQIARFIRAQNLSVYKPQFIYSSAEKLRPFMRELIECVFGCKVYDFYGSREVGPIAGEGRDGKLYIFSFNNYVEIVDENNQPALPGERGRVLVTTLHNYAMPLIRYEIGDTAILSKNPGTLFKLPSLDGVGGRVTDHFLTQKRQIVHGEYFTHLFYFRDWLKEFQVLQKKLDLIEIYFVSPRTPESSEVCDINEKVRLVMGKSCKINWHKVEEIPKTPQGKLLFTRSLIANH